MKNKIKMIALDMDGTCLNEKGEMTKETKASIESVGEKGILVVIATGRPLSGLSEEVMSLKNIGYIITLNGARVYKNEDKTTVFKQGISKDSLKEIEKILEQQDVLVDAFIENKGYCSRTHYETTEKNIKDKSFLNYYHFTRRPLEDLWKFINSQEESVEKINLFFNDLGRKEKLKNKLEGIDKVKISSGLENNLEVNDAMVDKGNALKRLTAMLDINMAEVLACGDSGNDMEMLRQVGISVVMENAKDEVKEIADFITLSNKENGVAYALKKYLG